MTLILFAIVFLHCLVIHQMHYLRGKVFKLGKKVWIQREQIDSLFDDIEDLQEQINDLASAPQEAFSIDLYVIKNGVLTRLEEMNNVTIDEVLDLVAVVKDRAGNPAKLDGNLNWSLTDASKGEINPTESTDGEYKATFKPSGPLGGLQVEASGDADLSGEVKPIIARGDINVLAGNAVSIEITGTARPAPQPEPAPEPTPEPQPEEPAPEAPQA